MIRNPQIRLAVVFTLTLAALGAGAAWADPACRPVHGRFSVQISGGPGCDSPVDLCGTVEWKGSLRADSTFVATEILESGDTPATGVVLVVGDNHVVTADGDLFTKDAVLLAAAGTFTEIDTIVGGTGAFAGATGSWVATGTVDGAEAEGSFAGEICWP